MTTGSDPRPGLQRVVIEDFDMPFGSMVRLMIKCAIAAIPALLILSVLGTIVSMLIALFWGLAAVPFMHH